MKCSHAGGGSPAAASPSRNQARSAGRRSGFTWRSHAAGAPGACGAPRAIRSAYRTTKRAAHGRAAALAEDWKARVGEGWYAFNDAHAAMAFVAAGRLEDAAAVVRDLEARAAGRGTNARMIADVALPVCRALLAFGQGRHAACLDALLPARAVAIRFGGSNAQRDVLSLLAVEAAARSLASERVRARPASPPAWLATARALEADGDPARAAQAREQAARLVARAVARAA